MSYREHVFVSPILLQILFASATVAFSPLKQLEAENARLNKLVAERDLQIEVMKEIAEKKGKRAGAPFRRVVRDRAGRGLSQRRACTLFDVARYRSRWAEKDGKQPGAGRRLLGRAKGHRRAGRAGASTRTARHQSA